MAACGANESMWSTRRQHGRDQRAFPSLCGSLYDRALVHGRRTPPGRCPDDVEEPATIPRREGGGGVGRADEVHEPRHFGVEAGEVFLQLLPVVVGSDAERLKPGSDFLAELVMEVGPQEDSLQLRNGGLNEIGLPPPGSP